MGAPSSQPVVHSTATTCSLQLASKVCVGPQSSGTKPVGLCELRAVSVRTEVNCGCPVSASRIESLSVENPHIQCQKDRCEHSAEESFPLLVIHTHTHTPQHAHTLTRTHTPSYPWDEQPGGHYCQRLTPVLCQAPGQVAECLCDTPQFDPPGRVSRCTALIK